jgi:hypothetical protein
VPVRVIIVKGHMSWDVLLLRLPDDVTSMEGVRYEDAMPLGRKPWVLDAVRRVLPGADLTDSEWGSVFGPSWSIELSIGSDDPVESIMLHVRGSGDDVLAPILRLTAELGCRALDSSSGALISSPEQTSGWHAFQEFRKRVIVRRHNELPVESPAAAGGASSFTDAEAARDKFALLAAAHQEREDRGPEHPRTLAARSNLAFWTGMAGDAAEARDQFAALLPVHERLLGPEHPDTLIVRGNLARWTGEAGDAPRARDQFAALLPVHAQLLGPEHPGVQKTREYLARWTGEAGDAAGARDQFAALLSVHERLLGPQHPGTRKTREYLAHWTGQAEDTG